MQLNCIPEGKARHCFHLQCFQQHYCSKCQVLQLTQYIGETDHIASRTWQEVPDDMVILAFASSRAELALPALVIRDDSCHSIGIPSNRVRPCGFA